MTTKVDHFPSASRVALKIKSSLSSFVSVYQLRSRRLYATASICGNYSIQVIDWFCHRKKPLVFVNINNGNGKPWKYWLHFYPFLKNSFAQMFFKRCFISTLYSFFNLLIKKNMPAVVQI
ncbi:hypothetical protein MPTK1_5g05060 [Marchantia polymorpha subsp. ruderalis]|uniref:Uncharacterized protein n=2 Tax=Marchantia polymorpha TaxID=3197 RepID=A0AAF6BF32_MARPO|nr:hypothetical protein MARPO_0027s0121 [Marchantia polymorpha]BBN10616.1 hypothetical protein Mp_5g05060 [Marchantia polymorpha subsp. ruderalis]|eukprot:PTQ43019.1 hypothetical protein MARPO_0027s0121 [Marchantia polymorpha]